MLKGTPCSRDNNALLKLGLPPAEQRTIVPEKPPSPEAVEHRAQELLAKAEQILGVTISGSSGVLGTSAECAIAGTMKNIVAKDARSLSERSQPLLLGATLGA